MHQSKPFKFLLFVFVLAILTPAAVFAANTKSLKLEHDGVTVNGKTFYIDIDDSSIRDSVETLLGRRIHISDGYLGVLENAK